MIRQTVVQLARPALRSSTALQRRTITSSVVRMAEGDTGAPRSGGSATGDSFNKREKANEDMFVKNQEREKLAKLREKIAAQQKHLKELDDHLRDMNKDQGGEHN